MPLCLPCQVSSLYVPEKCDYLSHNFCLRPPAITKFKTTERVVGAGGEVTSSIKTAKTTWQHNLNHHIIQIKTLFWLVIRRCTRCIHTDSVFLCSSWERELIGWRHETHRWCKIQRTLGLQTKQWRMSFYDFWRVISTQKKLRRSWFMVICLSLDLYFTFLRKTVGKKNMKISS